MFNNFYTYTLRGGNLKTKCMFLWKDCEMHISHIQLLFMRGVTKAHEIKVTYFRVLSIIIIRCHKSNYLHI
jgi:hypothetical protein